MDIEKYKKAVNRPGKFEGESPIVPYLWEFTGEALSFGVFRFHISEEEKEAFDIEKDEIYLREGDQGFVYEVDKKFL